LFGPLLERSAFNPKCGTGCSKTARNRSYLAHNRYEVVAAGEAVTDGMVGAAVLGGLRSGPNSVRQKPGPKNALGLVKFIFLNACNVYLHSPQSLDLFSRPAAIFSRGYVPAHDPAAPARDHVLARMRKRRHLVAPISPRPTTGETGHSLS
jgi:hypothetical protein